MSHNFLNDSDDFPEYENIEGNSILFEEVNQLLKAFDQFKHVKHSYPP